MYNRDKLKSLNLIDCIADKFCMVILSSTFIKDMIIQKFIDKTQFLISLKDLMYLLIEQVLILKLFKHLFHFNAFTLSSK